MKERGGRPERSWGWCVGGSGYWRNKEPGSKYCKGFGNQVYGGRQRRREEGFWEKIWKRKDLKVDKGNSIISLIGETNIIVC